MPMDKYSSFVRTPSLPAYGVQEITPSDTADLAEATLALNVASVGTVRVTTLDGTVSDVTIAPGEAFPLRVSRVWETGTTATGIRGLY
ncbi:spike base protein, RCAP_Rcc01079 family [Roseobacter sp. A03A-229]